MAKLNLQLSKNIPLAKKCTCEQFQISAFKVALFVV